MKKIFKESGKGMGKGMGTETILQSRYVYWATHDEKKAVQEGLRVAPCELRATIELLLWSILYAEKLLKQEGKKITLWLEKWKLHPLFEKTVGMWNFHLMHAKRFGYSTKEFRTCLKDPRRATEIVIFHLLNDIGIHKEPPFIFAEYNHNPMATAVVALQSILNRWVEPTLEEDGLIGPKTKEALLAHFNIEHITENEIVEILTHFGVAPFVPNRIIKKDLQFALRHKKFFAIFERDIHLPKYVSDALFAFNLLK